MRASLQQLYSSVRQLSEALAEPLSEADAQIQSMADASPTKWHLAHTSWFFEALVLKPFCPNYQVFEPAFNYLFNSYYNGIGEQYARSQRGLISRPSLKDVMSYRHHVDRHIGILLAQSPEVAAQPEFNEILTLGLHHEHQHQELMLTDIKHAFFQNPLFPIYIKTNNSTNLPLPLQWQEFEGGLSQVGYQEEGFAFDNELPVHQVYLQPFTLASRLVSNREFREFIEDGGYQNPLLWLSDGWHDVQKHNKKCPLYWLEREGEFIHFTLSGLRDIDPEQPVTHVNYYEADAFARWANSRLPTEFEWEVASEGVAVDGPFLDLSLLHSPGGKHDGLSQMFGHNWQWTSSAYAPYPGYRPFSGAAGEYNGKFMGNQYVLRGGSCATPLNSYRSTYRNFFYPHQSWQFTGIRLAR